MEEFEDPTYFKIFVLKNSLTVRQKIKKTLERI